MATDFIFDIKLFRQFLCDNDTIAIYILNVPIVLETHMKYLQIKWPEMRRYHSSTYNLKLEL